MAAKQLIELKYNFSDKKVKRWVTIFCFAVAFILYGNTISNRYAMDDSIVTVSNDTVPNEKFMPINKRVVKGIAAIPDFFTEHYGNEEGMSYDYRPITSSSYAIEYQFFGQNPHVSHFINVVLYGCLLLVIFQTLLLLFGEVYFVFISFIVLLFAAHPIHTEVVASLKSRDEIFSFLFSVIALKYAIKFYDSSKLLSLILSVIFLTLGILSKLSAELFIVIIPVSVLIFKGWQKRNGILLITAMIVPFAIISLINVTLPPEIRYFLHYENPLLLDGDGLIPRIIASINCVGFYVIKLVFPITLVFYYGHAEVRIDNVSNVNFAVGLVTLLVGAYFFFKHYKSNKILTFGLFFFFSTLLAASNLIKLVTGIVGERLVFVSSLGFCVLIVYILFSLIKLDFRAQNYTLKSSFKLVFGTIVFLFLVRTFIRNQDWKDELTLYRHDTPLAPNSAKANAMLSNYLFPVMSRTNDNQERLSMAQEVIKHYEIAISVDSSNYAWYHNLASTYGSFQDTYAKAIPLYKKAIELKREVAKQNVKVHLSPDYPVAYQNLGYVYSMIGQDSLAIVNFEMSLKQDPKNEFTYKRYIDLYMNRKNLEGAESIINRGLKILGKSYQLSSIKGNLLLQKGDINGAAMCYEDAYDAYNDPKLAAYIIKQYTKSGMTDKLINFKKRFGLQ